MKDLPPPEASAARLLRSAIRLPASIFLVVILSLAWVDFSGAQEPTRPAASIQITFLPPPLEHATYSLGIFDAKSNQLVRSLKEIALEKDFTVGLNGLITTWDGKDDYGHSVPPGRYAARGYAVGPLQVEGKGIFENDWAGDDEGIRMRFVTSIAFVPEDGGFVALGGSGFNLRVVRYGGEKCRLLWQRISPGVRVLVGSPSPKYTLGLQSGLVKADEVAAEGSAHLLYTLADGKDTVLPPGVEVKTGVSDHCPGKDGTLWKIEDGVLSQYSAGGERLRRLPWKEGEPVPVAVAASTTSDRLYLLERSTEVQRVRGLSWKATSQEGGNFISTWATFFEHEIRRFRPGESEGPGSPPKSLDGVPLWYNLTVPLAGNPLSPAKAERLRLGVVGSRMLPDGSCAAGGYLATADGLRLRQISDRPGIVTGDLARGKTADSLLFFQYDGAAWDEFSVEGLQNILAFDAGEFELTATGEKPADTKTEEPPDL